MKKIFLIPTLMFLMGNAAILSAQVEVDPEDQCCNADSNFEDSYEDSDVDSANPQPQVSWPGINRDPFYDKVTR